MILRHFILRKLLFISLCCISITASGQDLVFSQYYNSPIHINPAFAGLNNYPQFTSNYRLQWPGISNVYKTFAFSYDQYFNKFNSGLGFTALTDDQGEGTLKTTEFSGIYAYKLRFRQDWQLKFGLEVGYSQSRLDFSKLIFFDQIDPGVGPFDSAGVPFPSGEIPPDNLSNAYMDVNFGMLLYNPLFYVGITFDHINGPYNGFLASNSNQNVAIPIVVAINAGTQIVLESDNKGKPSTFISPNVLFAQQSGFSQLNIGAYMQIKQLFGGAWIRHTLGNLDAFIFTTGVDLDYIKIGYSFDLTGSSLSPNTGGSHEIGIILRLKNLEKKESKYNDCFSLFR